MTQWQPIETAPKDGTDILLFEAGRVTIGHWWSQQTVQHGKTTATIEQWWDGRFLWSTKPDPTHWMPVPAPPSNGIIQSAEPVHPDDNWPPRQKSDEQI